MEEWITDLVLKDQEYNAAHATEPSCTQVKMFFFYLLFFFMYTSFIANTSEFHTWLFFLTPVFERLGDSHCFSRLKDEVRT